MTNSRYPSIKSPDYNTVAGCGRVVNLAMLGWAGVRALKLTITSDDNDMIEHDFLKPDVMTFTPRSLAGARLMSHWFRSYLYEQ